MSGDADSAAREVLLSKRAEIVARVDALGEHDPAEVANLGFGKRIGDATSYAVGRMTDAYQARTIYATVADIDQALERLDAGTYGRCIACGTPIPAERLEAVPWAALCVPCSAKPARSRLVR
jgi:DnaK suppressor protein